MAHPVFVDYYKVLHVPMSATKEQIRSAYLLLAKTHHPDKGGNVHGMRALNQAYGTLKNSANRTEYDRKYRKHILGQKITDLSFNENEDWDLDEVDEFLNEVYRQDKRRLWARPYVTSLMVVGVGLLLFVIIAVTRMMSTSDMSQAAFISQEKKR